MVAPIFIKVLSPLSFSFPALLMFAGFYSLLKDF